MSAIENDILIKNDFVVDGKKSIQASNEVLYIGYLSATYDVTIFGEDEDIEIPLSFNGVIKRIIITNESVGDLLYKLNGVDEPYLLRTQLILTQQPTSLTITNEDDANKVIRIKIIGEED